MGGLFNLESSISISKVFGCVCIALFVLYLPVSLCLLVYSFYLSFVNCFLTFVENINAHMITPTHLTHSPFVKNKELE